MEFTHRPVLLESTVNALVDPGFDAKSRVFRPDGEVRSPDGVYVDGTFGRGGHSSLLLSRLGPNARLVVFDKDPVAIQAARELRAKDARVEVVHGGFASMFEELQALGLKQVDGIMLDLGVSSPQIDDAERGFSFMRDGPLDMRMDTSSGMTAAQWLAEADLEEIREVIAKYGEERFAFQIAKAVVGRRESRPLCTTLDLAELVASVVRTREKGQHPATRSFQALRIHINQELEELARALAAALRLLAPGGRLAVISFHSLEDRMVKQCIAAARRRSEAQSRMPIFEKDMPRPILESLGKVLSSAEEARENPRARSAVLRVAQRTSEPLPDDEGASFINSIRLVPKSASRPPRRKK
ncbi:16S rRNA (cytosine(1402)-N(4))-methyltransferase RsmH [Pusillimonas sp.]|uniref:16S rRNA (cytosine(1402)-N(4))-methyltransferase RsmH n=1 Tax=Pusillimonas sp. TaxID=3040095 RepID=UPI0037C610FD